jgi:hypothetical protein
LVKTAYRALLWRIVKYLYFRRNTGNQKHLPLIIKRRIADYTLLTQSLFTGTETFFDKSKACSKRRQNDTY